MPPPSLSITTMHSGTSRRPIPSSPLVSWTKATSPITSTVGLPLPSATPTAVEVTPSMPLAPRFEYTAMSPRRSPYHSRSRTGIEDDTTRLPPGGTLVSAVLVMSGSPARSSMMARRAERSASYHRLVHSSGAGAGEAWAS